MIQPLADWHLAERTPPEERIGQVWLPDAGDGPATDLLVTASGPGRIRRDGTQDRQQAQPGDRIVCLAHQVRPVDQSFAFVRDRDLVGVVPGPERTEFRPAGEYVLIDPDRPETQTESGLILSRQSFAGGEARELRRGRELFAEFRAWSRSEKFRLLPAWEQHRAVVRRAQDLPLADQYALREILDSEDARGSDDFWKRYVPLQARKAPRSGMVLAGSPTYWKGTAGRSVIGNHVWWDRDAVVIRLSVAGAARVCVPAGSLCAVEAP